jgi:hypothetical protein
MITPALEARIVTVREDSGEATGASLVRAFAKPKSSTLTLPSRVRSCASGRVSWSAFGPPAGDFLGDADAADEF